MLNTSKSNQYFHAILNHTIRNKPQSEYGHNYTYYVEFFASFYKVFLRTNSLPFGKVLNGPCRIGAHGEEANEWRLWIALFPGGFQVKYHSFSVPLTHGICDIFAGLMQCTVRAPRSGIHQSSNMLIIQKTTVGLKKM